MEKSIYLTIYFVISSLIGKTQNLPSLLNDRNINSTFSILAFDEKNQEWGIAVATNNIYVGNSTIYVEPGIGGFSVIAETLPDYAINGLDLLKQGKSIEQAILFTKNNDDEAHYRQIAGIDQHGNVFAFTGQALKYWNGQADHYLGKHFVVMGNQLADQVIEQMAKTFEASRGTLAERLLKSITAGQIAGGQITGKLSAALVVKGVNNEWYNQIDLRVDYSDHPIEELQRLLNYHYGRIRINQSRFALEYGNKDRAIKKLKEAEELLDGWNGMYGNIALINYVLENEDAAIDWINKAILENPQWIVNLPAFYFLNDHPRMKSLIDAKEFSVTDWENAVNMLINLNREEQAISLSKKLISENKESSYLYFLLGKSYYRIENRIDGKKSLEKAIQLDNENVEAKQLLKTNGKN